MEPEAMQSLRYRYRTLQLDHIRAAQSAFAKCQHMELVREHHGANSDEFRAVQRSYRATLQREEELRALLGLLTAAMETRR